MSSQQAQAPSPAAGAGIAQIKAPQLLPLLADLWLYLSNSEVSQRLLRDPVVRSDRGRTKHTACFYENSYCLEFQHFLQFWDVMAQRFH